MEQKRRSNRVRDLPRWFDLTKYEGLAALDLHGWSYQISARSDLNYSLHVIDKLSERLSESDLQYWITDVHDLLASISENPIIDSCHDSEHLRIWRSRIAEKPYDTYSVWSLAPMDAFHLAKHWKTIAT